jgi:hypothetical protein
MKQKILLILVDIKSVLFEMAFGLPNKNVDGIIKQDM